MFQFSGFAHLSVYYVFNIVGCPIRISADHLVCANPRSFSQLITSFFASESHRHPPYALILLIVLYVSVYKIQTSYAFYIFSCVFLSQYVNELFSSNEYIDMSSETDLNSQY